MRRSADGTGNWRTPASGVLATILPTVNSTPFTLLLLIGGFFLLAANPLPLHATDDEVIRSSGLFGTDEDFTLSYDQLEVDVEEGGGGRSLVLLGNVVLTGRGFDLRADAIGIFIEGIDAGGNPVGSRVVAVGGVLLSRGDQSFRAESLFYEVATRSLVCTDARIRLSQSLIEDLRTVPFDDPRRARLVQESFIQRERDVPASVEEWRRLVFAAKELRVDDFSRFEGEEFQFTTCDFGVPSWAISSERGEATLRQEKSQRPDEDHPGGYRLGMQGVKLQFSGVSVLPLPSIRWDTRWGRYIPLRSLALSSSTKFGDRIDTAWDSDIFLPEGWKEDVDLIPRVDWLSARGVGFGADIEYGRDPNRWANRPDGRVELYGFGSYWQIEDEASADQDGFVPPDPDRYRARFFQHARLSSNTLIDVEVSLDSDRGFVDEFFEGEARGEKAPENTMYLRQPWGESAAVSLLVQRQLVDHRSVLERDPEIRLRWIESPGLYFGLQADADLSTSDLRQTYDEALGTADYSRRRSDFRLALSRPMGIPRWFRVRPMVEARFTNWHDSPGVDGVERNILAYGGTIASRFWRTFDYTNDTFGIRGLRHVVDITADYRNVHSNDLENGMLVPLDEIDTLGSAETLTLGMVHRLQTRGTGGYRRTRLGIDTLLEAKLDALWFPDPHADNGGEEWGPGLLDLELYPVGGWTLFAESRSDLSIGRLEEINAGIRWLQAETGLLEFSRRQRDGFQDTYIAGGRWLASERYEFGAFFEYDRLREKTVGEYFTLGRNFNRWTVLLSVEVDEGEGDDTIFRIRFGPRDLLDRNRTDRRRSGLGLR